MDTTGKQTTKSKTRLNQSSNFTLSPVENTFQKTAAEKYKNAVSTKNPLKDPTSSTKNPAPTVPIIAAKVPAVFDKPIQQQK